MIPARNEASGIATCLQALCSQLDTLEHELLVIDSASTDETAAIAASFGATVHHLDRAGQLLAKRTGVDLAKGELIAVLDADCIVSKGWVRAVIDALADDPGLVAVTCYYDYGVGMPAWGRRYSQWMSGWLANRRTAPLPFVLGGNVAFRRTALSDDMYPMDGSIADTECLLAETLHRFGRIGYVEAMRVTSDPRRFRSGVFSFFVDYKWKQYLYPELARRLRRHRK